MHRTFWRNNAVPCIVRNSQCLTKKQRATCRLIANKLRGCWNVNAGVEGAEEMSIELRASVGRDGRVKDVRVLNNKNNPVFRSMADSAVRAVYICDSLGEESPFKILSTKHLDNYNSWKEIHLRMNPVDGGVF